MAIRSSLDPSTSLPSPLRIRRIEILLESLNGFTIMCSDPKKGGRSNSIFLKHLDFLGHDGRAHELQKFLLLIFLVVIGAFMIIREPMLTAEVFLAAAPKGDKTELVTTPFKLTPLGSSYNRLLILLFRFH